MSIIKKIFDYLVWLTFFGFFLLGGIIYATNKTYPGDDLYSFKLKFESFALATSKILNKQVDFSIDLVSKRSSEVSKILTSKNSEETLNRLDTQVESTAISISQISDPVEKKKAATKYIAKLNEVSSVLSEKQKEFVATPQQPEQKPTEQQIQNQPIQPTKQDSQNIVPTTTIPLPSPTLPPEISEISQQIDNSQETIQQTIDEMNQLASQSSEEEERIEKEREKDEEKDKEKGREKDKEKKKDEEK